MMASWRFFRRAALLLALAVVTAGLCARGSNALERTFQLGTGLTEFQDTYLSPNVYRGQVLRFGVSTDLDTRFNDTAFTHRFDRTLYGHFVSMRGVTSRTAVSQVMLEFRHTFPFWNLERSYFSNRLSVKLQPNVQSLLGVAYKPSNSNNIVAARFQLSTGVAARADFPVRVGGKTVGLRSQLSLPLVGIMFVPEYGQLYYEMMESEQLRLALKPVWIGQSLTGEWLNGVLDVMATVPFGHTDVRFQVSLENYCHKFHNLKAGQQDFFFTVGLTRRLKRL